MLIFNIVGHPRFYCMSDSMRNWKALFAHLFLACLSPGRIEKQISGEGFSISRQPPKSKGGEYLFSL